MLRQIKSSIELVHAQLPSIKRATKDANGALNSGK